MQVSFYPNTFSKDITNVDSHQIATAILTGEWANQISLLRNMSPEEYKEKKKMLAAVTWSGVFTQGTRLIESIQQYSSLTVIDVDKIDTDKIKLLKRQISKDPHVLYIFTSPSGNGIKVVYLTDVIDANNHRASFMHLQEYFENNYFVKVDPSGKDVCRLCYVSYDPEMIIKSAVPFEVNVEKYNTIVTGHVHTSASEHEATNDLQVIFNRCVKWVERNKEYVDGQKNVYIHALACAMNRCGCNPDETIGMIDRHYTTPDTKWHQSVRSAFFHNQHEHNTVKVKDIDENSAYIAPPYIANYTDDVAANDIMRITAMLYNYKLQTGEIMDVVGKIGSFYDKMGYVDYRRASLVDMMNHAVQTLQSNIAIGAAKDSLVYETAEDMGRELVKIDLVNGMIKTYIQPIDLEMYGGMLPGTFYELIGLGGTYKSVVAQFMAYKNAINDIPVLYLNGEMSKFQFYGRLALQAMGVNMRRLILNKELTEDNIDSFIEQLAERTKRNIFVVNGNGFNQKNVYATIQHIYATTGKQIKLIIADGITQMDAAGKDEIQATIYNSGVCKEIAKQTNCVVVGLLHMSGDAGNLTLRDTGKRVRGGIKTTANADGYFSTSKLIDPHCKTLDNPDEIEFLENKFYLRLTDKRTETGIVSYIINVDSNLHLTHEETPPQNYEINPNKRN